MYAPQIFQAMPNKHARQQRAKYSRMEEYIDARDALTQLLLDCTGVAVYAAALWKMPALPPRILGMTHRF